MVANELDRGIVTAPDYGAQAVRKPCLPRQVVGARVGPDENITCDDVVRQRHARENVVGHARRPAYRRQLDGTVPVRHREHRMQSLVGSQGVIGSPAVADQVAAFVPLLAVENADSEYGRAFGHEAAVFEPDFFELREQSFSRANRVAQIRERAGSIVSGREATAAVDDARLDVRALADAADMYDRTRKAAGRQPLLSQVEMNAVDRTAGCPEIGQRRLDLAAGHPELAAEVRISSVTFIGGMDAHADSPAAARRNGRQFAYLRRRVEMHPQIWSVPSRQPVMLGDAVDEDAIGRAALLEDGGELVLADHFNAAAAVNPSASERGQRMSLER